MSELDDLKNEVKALKDQINPPPRPPSTWQPIDYTANATMPPSAMKEMMKAVPDALMRDLRGDARRPNPVTEASSSPLSTPSALPTTQKRGTGWVPERGFPDRTKEFELVDRMVEKMVGGPNDPLK